MVKRTISDRQFCFQLITPTRIYILGAETNKDLFEWIYSLRKEFTEQLKKFERREITNSQELKDTQNVECADCTKKPALWVNLTHKVFICTGKSFIANCS